MRVLPSSAKITVFSSAPLCARGYEQHCEFVRNVSKISMIQFSTERREEVSKIACSLIVSFLAFDLAFKHSLCCAR